MTPDEAGGLADLIGHAIVGCTCERFTVVMRRDTDGHPVEAAVVHADTTCPALLEHQIDAGPGGDRPHDERHLHGPDDPSGGNL